MMASFDSLLQQLDQEIIDECLSWDSPAILFTVATSLHDDTPQEINIVDTIGYNVQVRKHYGKYWLPSTFSENSTQFRKQTLIPAFQRACLPCGFALVAKGWEGNKGTNLKLSFRCKRGRYRKKGMDNNAQDQPEVDFDPVLTEATVQDDNQPAKPKRVPTTQLPVKGGKKERCPFLFSVYWHESLERWYLPQKQQGCSSHLGHKREKSIHVPCPMSMLTQEEQKLNDDGMEENISNRAMSGLHGRRSNMLFEDHQMKYRKTRVREEQLVNMIGDSGITDMLQTPADKLLSRLDAMGDSSYVALYGEYDSQLLTVKQVSKSMRNSIQEEYHDLSEFDDGVDCAEQLIKKLRIKNNLSITGSGLILLGIAWTDDSASKRFELFPEFCASDVLEGTNSEERPMLMMTTMPPTS